MEVQQQQRSLSETPAYAVASVVTVMVFVCFLVERSIYRFGEWLEKTKRKAVLASLGKIKEELMLLGLISLLLGQSGSFLSEICVNASLFNSQFYLCSEQDVGFNEMIMLQYSPSAHNVTANLASIYNGSLHQCDEGLEPLISYEGLEQLHRFLFVLGITHVFYSCVVVGLAMCKIYSWSKWENQANVVSDRNIVPAKMQKAMRRQCTFVFNHTYHPWSKNHILIWMLCFLRQFKGSIQKSDYLALRLGFITAHELPPCYDFHRYMIRSMEDEFQCILGISWLLWAYTILCISVNIHGLNTYFWLSFVPAILVMLVGTKLQHVVLSLALGMEQTSACSTPQVKPRDDHFWFQRPEILFRLIQFVIFQNAFEMATFIWSLWVLQERSCFMKDHHMIAIRLACGVLILLWCSYMTVPLNVIVSQEVSCIGSRESLIAFKISGMGSRYKKAIVGESVRDSLQKWRERVKARPKHDLHAPRSFYCLDTIVEMMDHKTLESGALSQTSCLASSNQITTETVNSVAQLNCANPKAVDDDDVVSCQAREFSTDRSVNVGASCDGADHVNNEA